MDNQQNFLGATPTEFQQSMTRKEFRYNMFENLKDSGIADKLKSQLRAKLVAQLKQKSLFSSRASPVDSKNSSLINRAIDSLVVDYLKRRGNEFTLSVFLPECGLTGNGGILQQDDIYRVFHIDKGASGTTLVKTFRSYVDQFPESSSIIVKLLESLSKVFETPSHEKECQTNMDEEETVDSEIRRLDSKFISTSATLSHPKLVAAMEQRIQRYQQDLELRVQQASVKQQQTFEELQLSQMRSEERSRFSIELAKLKNDYEQKLVDQRDKLSGEEETHRRMIVDREKELEKSNLTLRQQLLEESSKRVLVETQLRSEAEITAKTLQDENSRLMRRISSLEEHLADLETFKERYATKTQEALAEYKISLNKEHQGLLSNVEVEKARLASEKAILVERTKIAERMMQEINDNQTEMNNLHEQAKNLKLMLSNSNRERDEALFLTRDLKLQLSSQSSGAALEFEIQSLKTQLFEAERMNEKRQEEYQSLLKNMMTPQHDIQKELSKLRRSESKWQRECQDLVAKLDLELNRNEEIQRKYEDEVLKNKELKRDVSELKLILHRLNATNDGLASEHIKAFSQRDILPNPLDFIHRSDTTSPSSFRNLQRGANTPKISTKLPMHCPGNDSPPRKTPPPTSNFSPVQQDFSAAWDQGIREMEAVAYRSGMGAFGYYDNGERERLENEHEANNNLQINVDVGKSFTEEVLESLPEVERSSLSYSKNFAQRSAYAQQQIVHKMESIQAKNTLQKQQPQQIFQQNQIPATQQHSIEQQDIHQQEQNLILATQSINDIRKSFEESVKSLSQPEEKQEISKVQSEAPNYKNESSAVAKLSLQELLRKEKEEEEAINLKMQQDKIQADYETRRVERERRTKELEELEMHVAEESTMEKHKARLAGLNARETEHNRQSEESSSFSKKPSSSSEKSQDSNMKLLNDLEADPIMQKYIAIVKDKRERAANVAQDEKASKILSALENSSLISSDESAVSKIISGATVDDISAPSTSEEILDDPW
ncbi:oxidative DNA demethylase [Physocladia obscura]|uniref:Oxidative DNA demethylase n=1 Tax=Physocladia obscura TaxID=109957 RepID=A0AAD5SSJ1_9FUNG|nr:oxidative DNA demethylase [Physocladia obscura]